MYGDYSFISLHHVSLRNDGIIPSKRNEIDSQMPWFADAGCVNRHTGLNNQLLN